LYACPADFFRRVAKRSWRSFGARRQLHQRHCHLLFRHAQTLHQQRGEIGVLRRQQRVRLTEQRFGAIATTRASNAMRVRVNVAGGIEADHCAHVGQIEAARRDIGRHQHVVALGAKALERVLARRTGHVAVQAVGAHTVALQIVGESRRVFLVRDEHKHCAVLDEARQRANEPRVLELRRVKHLDNLHNALVGLARPCCRH
jgi:hypothetical protein